MPSTDTSSPKRSSRNVQKSAMMWCETILVILFVLVTVAAGLLLNGWVTIPKHAQYLIGDFLVAFGLLTFFYITHKSSQARSK